MAIKRGIDKAVDLVLEQLKKISKPTKEKTEITQVGTVSANNDSTIGDLIGAGKRPLSPTESRKQESKEKVKGL